MMEKGSDISLIEMSYWCLPISSPMFSGRVMLRPDTIVDSAAIARSLLDHSWRPSPPGTGGNALRSSRYIRQYDPSTDSEAKNHLDVSKWTPEERDLARRLFDKARTVEPSE